MDCSRLRKRDKYTSILATDLTDVLIESVQHKARRRILRTLNRHNCLDKASVDEMLAWDHHGGFSCDASVVIPEWDRHGLERPSQEKPPHEVTGLRRNCKIINGLQGNLQQIPGLRLTLVVGIVI